MFKLRREAVSTPAETLFSADGSDNRRAKAWLDARLARAKKAGAFEEVVEITPAIAELLLSLNTSNRALRRGQIKKISEAISAGRWKLTHQGIAVSDIGTLLDGQHRLHAIILSGRSVLLKIAFGEPSINFDVIDTHKSRGQADTLCLLGEEYSALLASALTMLYSIEQGQPRGNASGACLHNDEIQSYLGSHPGMRTACTVAQSSVKYLKCAPTPLAVAYYLIAKKYPQKAGLFFETMRTGLGLTSRRDAIWVLRQAIQDNFSRGVKKTRVARPTLAANVIIAFNKWVNGASTRTVKWDDGDAFPEVV